ncbi:MAG: protein kinase [Candidatus Hydrogenedentes bacterium]|nr:protein kinase [Candidatus Hydrogenedentota bacterium]
MGIVYWYWNVFLGEMILIRILGDNITAVPAPAIVFPLIKIVITLFLIYFLFYIAKTARKMLRNVFRRDTLADSADVRALQNQGGPTDFQQTLMAARDIDATIAPLKKARNYQRMGEVYASINRHKEAAKWFGKAGDRKRSAMEMAKMGNTLKAAKILMKEGDYGNAASFFADKGKFVDAAKAYERSGFLAKAASCYAQAGSYGPATEAYKSYFESPKDTAEAQLVSADECARMLDTEPGKSKISAEQRKALLPYLAGQFESAKRYDHAAALYKELGNFDRAGEVCLLAGKLEEAAACKRQAGKEKEAAQIAGRFHQAKGNWREAATAFAQAGDFMSAGEMFARASDAVRAGECFERAGEFYRAGLAYAHAARFEPAIKALQKIPENHANFEQSRALLGRCFYELHDYAHCAAALENHLLGKRVDTGNTEYFYMWALALEQLGKLDESRDILLKIRTVNVGFKDVSTRLSNISSRISMAHAAPAGAATVYTPQPGMGQGAAATVATQVMESVESNLGGRYVLEQELGRGGMGVVYLARDSQLDRPVALKFLGNLVDSSEEFRQRFVREARTAAKISHPNIIAIYDISASVGKAYIAMEYVDGPSLHKYLTSKGGLKARETINVIVQACNALAAIHEAGIVHRDIKPDNILIAKGGLIKLTDFGLAKAEDSRMTRTGVVMGTPSYMAPEQVLGKEADARSDIYSMGLVMYECLSGETVFMGQDVIERQLKETPPPPSQKVEGVPPALNDIVMKCIDKKPEDRFQTVRELITALRAVQ